MAKRALKRKRIAALAADGFEKVELTVPMKALKLAGAKVDVVSLREGSIRGVNLHEPASRVEVTKTVAQADPDDYDALLVPGGFFYQPRPSPAIRGSARVRASI
jgi:protease I